MIRRVIKIDEAKCVGCQKCVNACHEGAIAMVDGKAKLMRDDYCDGLGNCLPVCPTNAISFEEREAEAFDQVATKANMQKAAMSPAAGFTCPGSAPKPIQRPTANPVATGDMAVPKSQLQQWPLQIKLVPINAPYFNDAKLLVAADCSAFAYGDFHNRFMRDKVTLIGCPKLDEGDYAEKLTAIIQTNNIKNVTIVRMEVPCCGGLEQAVRTALQASGKFIPWQVVTISLTGEILDSL